MSTVFYKEMGAYFRSLIAYLVVGLYLVVMGLVVWVFPETSVIHYGFAELTTFFTVGSYVLVFLIPAITMKTFAEEKKMRTLELLLTKPISDGELVMAKFMASFLLVCFAIGPTGVYYASVYYLGNPQGNIDTSAVIGSYMGMLLVAAVFCAVGMFTSSLTSNQIISFLISSFLCFFLYAGLDSLGNFLGNDFVKRISMVYHYVALSKGLLDTRDVIYLMSLIGLFLITTRTVLRSRLW